MKAQAKCLNNAIKPTLIFMKLMKITTWPRNSIHKLAAKPTHGEKNCHPKLGRAT